MIDFEKYTQCKYVLMMDDEHMIEPPTHLLRNNDLRSKRLAASLFIANRKISTPNENWFIGMLFYNDKTDEYDGIDITNHLIIGLEERQAMKHYGANPNKFNRDLIKMIKAA